jgi:hypothetical protein
MLASFYSNTDIIDERTGSDSQILFFNPIDNDSSKTGNYSRASSSSSSNSNFLSSDNHVFNKLQLTSPSKSPRLSNNNQRLYRPQRSGDDDDNKLKSIVSTTKDITSTYPSKISENRGTTEQTFHEMLGSFRHENEYRENKPNSPSPSSRTRCPQHNADERSERSEPRKNEQNGERDFWDNWNNNRNKSVSSSMIDHPNRIVQHNGPQGHSLPETWSSSDGKGAATRFPYREQPGPFGINDEGNPPRGVGKAVREHSFMLPLESNAQSQNHPHLPPPPHRMGSYTVPVRQESYSHDSDGRDYGYGGERPSDKECRPHQGVQWLGKSASGSGRAPRLDRPLSSTSTRHIPECEDIDDGHTPYYVSRPEPNLQTRSKPVQETLALTPYIKSEVDSDSDVVILRKSKKS